jgi:hypothetical protein
MHCPGLFPVHLYPTHGFWLQKVVFWHMGFNCKYSLSFGQDDIILGFPLQISRKFMH